MTHTEDIINADTLEMMLKEFAKQYRKVYGTAYCELIIVGGASIVANYGFRASTSDIDYYEPRKRPLKDVIQAAANKLGISNDWMNDDFIYSSSFSDKLAEKSKHYKVMNNGSIEVRMVDAEYLIAMKVKSGREAGNDISDIIGILYKEKEKGNSISYEMISKAGAYLYGDKFIVEKSLESRLKHYCKCTVTELIEIYKKNLEESSQIKSLILEKINKGEIEANRNSVVAAGRNIMETMENSAKKLQFHMLCGLPGSGKTEKAKEIIDRLSISGFIKKNSEELYPIMRCIDEYAILTDEARILANVKAVEGYNSTCVMISANGIRDEMQKTIGYFNDEIVFLIARARIKTAIMSGASVVFDATNTDRKMRQDYLEMVKSLSPIHTELHVLPFPEKVPTEIPEHVIKSMAERVAASIPFENEGWDKIETSGLSIQDLGYDMNLCITEEDGYEWDDFM